MSDGELGPMQSLASVEIFSSTHLTIIGRMTNNMLMKQIDTQGGDPVAMRRGFLKLTVGSAMGISILGYVERFLPLAIPSVARAGRMPNALLSNTEFDTLEAFARVVIGVVPGQLATGEARTAERVELELSKGRGALAADVKAALKIIEFLPLLWGAGARLTRLSIDQQVDTVVRMQFHSNALLRSAYNGLRTLCIFLYYTDPRAWPRIGYAGPWAPSKFYEAGNRIVNLPRLQGGVQ